MRITFRFLYFVIFFILPFITISQTAGEQLKQIRSTVVEQYDGKSFYIHTVKRGQTLYMISKAYGVEVNDLIRENPLVKEGIKADQKIRIPMPGQKPGEATVKKEVTKEKPASGKVKPTGTSEKPDADKDVKAREQAQMVPADTVEQVLLPCGLDTTTKKKVYQVALMMPLFLPEVNMLNTENPGPRIFETSKSLQFVPFYEGFRMGLDSLEKSGLRIKLYVYDLDKDTNKTKQVLLKPEMKNMDLIIGLLYHRNFQIVSAFAEKNKINLVNPISERSELVARHPYVFKVRPAKKSLISELADYMAGSFSRGQILIVRSGQYADREAPERLKKQCLELNLDVQVVEGQEGAIGRLSKEKENYIVSFTDNSAYAHDLTRRLFELREEYNLTLVGLPNWSAMDGLEIEYLISLKTHMVSANLVDYDNSAVKNFIRHFQFVYKADPPLLAFQGFDVACYFLSALKNWGTNIQRCVPEYRMRGLQNNFEFIQSKGNGFENQHWNIFRYESYKLVKAN